MIDAYQAEEIVKCQRSCTYFVQQYGWMRHPRLGVMRFVPWDWQLSLLNLWQAGKSTISNKSRQVGASWTAVAYATWLINFHPELDILLLSQKEEKAKKLLAKLTHFFNKLPDWLRARTISDSQTAFGVAVRYYDALNERWVQGDGTVSSLTTTGTSGAGESARAVIIDEFALMSERSNDEAVWAAVAPTTTHGGQLIILSTPRGSFGEFYRIWGNTIQEVVELGIAPEVITNYRQWNRQVLSRADEMEMVPTAIHYSMCYHDEAWLKAATRGLDGERVRKVRETFSGLRYDDAWRDKQARRLKFSKNQMAQEFELEFDQMFNAAFSTEDLNACWVDPRKDSWVQAMMSASRYYYIGVDTAEGIQKGNREPDYNAIVVLNQFGVQVHALYNRENIDQWAGHTEVDSEGKAREVKGTVLRTIERFQPCTVIVEKNGGGLTVQNRIEPYLPDETDFIVLAMSGSIKPQLVNDFAVELADQQAYSIDDGKLKTIRYHIITDYATVRQMRHYVRVGPGKFEAISGAFDDLVVAYLWAAYARRLRPTYDAMAALPHDRDGNRPIALEKEDDLTPEDLAHGDVFGPMALPMEDALEGMVMNPYDGGGGDRELSGNNRGLSGGGRSLGGRR